MKANYEDNEQEVEVGSRSESFDESVTMAWKWKISDRVRKYVLILWQKSINIKIAKDNHSAEQ